MPEDDCQLSRVPRTSLEGLAPESPIQTSHHSIVLFPGMEPMLRSISEDADNARQRVWIETFIYRADRLGSAFGETLAKAAERGADVRLLYDPLGSKETPQEFFDALAARGVQVRAYRPASVAAQSADPGPRDHSRVIVIDEDGYTGGAAWGDEWLPRRCGGQGWHDVCTKVRGPVVGDFQNIFIQRWNEALDGSLSPSDYSTCGKYPDLEFVSDAPDHDDIILDRHRTRIQRAQTRIWIENAYFFPPVELLEDLAHAVKRGVDVRVIVPKVTDLPVLRHAACAEYERWLELGLQIYEYSEAIVHSKYAVIDDDWATVGTYNANVTSTRWVNEVNLFVFDPGYVARVAAMFESDLRHCDRVTAETIAARGLLEQIKDRLAQGALAVVEGT